jgi:hypothetical protein
MVTASSLEVMVMKALVVLRVDVTFPPPDAPL